MQIVTFIIPIVKNVIHFASAFLVFLQFLSKPMVIA